MALDLTPLMGFTGYTSMMLAASKASRAAAKAEGVSTNPAVLVPTPWDETNARPETERLRNALQTTKFIDESDPSFDKDGVPEDHKKLFALYKALSTLQILANEAADKTTPSGTLAGLDRRFQDGFQQVLTYANGLTLDTLSLITGPKRQTVETETAVARSTSIFQTRALVQGDPQQELPGLQNSGPFTIRVSKGNSSLDVQIDLAGMGATPRNLGNVINFINGKLADAGVASRMSRVELPQAEAAKNQPTPAKQYALKIEGNGTEQFSFIASAATPALYLANQGTGAAELRKLDLGGAEPATVYRAPIEAGGDMDVTTTARDANSNVFVLGATAADQGAQLNQAPRDVMLRKYDSAGNLLWSKLLGASDKVSGMALAIDSTGAAVVAGQITGKLGTATSAGGLDSFVVKYTAGGEEAFARQFGSALDDGATALAVGPDDAIYVGGNVKARMVGAAGANGATDGYIVKFNTTGTRQYTRQFGGTGDEKVSALAIGSDGNIVVASSDGGQGTVRKFSAADATNAAIWTQGIGNLSSGGAISGLAIDGGNIYLAGSTSNPALSGSSIARAHGGGQDGFVLRLDDAGASVATGTLTYLGTGENDRINGIAVAGGRVFVAGETKGQLPGATQTREGVSNAFAAEIAANGSLAWARQFGVSTGVGFGKGISADATGASALDALGLPKGKLDPAMTRTITAQTTTRVGDYFEIKMGELSARKITIEAGETMTTLARKINRVLFLDGKATVVRTSAGERIRIEPREGAAIELKRGTGNLDALAGLGLSPGRVVKPAADGEKAEDTDALPAFALGFKAFYGLTTTTNAATARSAIESAMAEIRKAYREITMDPETKKLMESEGEKKGKQGGVVPAYLTAQLANYNAGLQRLTGGQSSGSLF